MWNVINSSSISLLLKCIQQSENKKAQIFRQYSLCLSTLLENRFVDWFDFWDIHKKVIELCSLFCPGNCLSTIHEEPVASPASTVSGERNGVKTVPRTSRKTFNPALFWIRIRSDLHHFAGCESTSRACRSISVSTKRKAKLLFPKYWILWRLWCK